MRRLAESIYSTMIKLHTFTLRRRVKTSASLLYVVLAVIATIWRQQVRLLGRALLTTPWSLQIKATLLSAIASLGQVMQQAQGLFR